MKEDKSFSGYSLHRERAPGPFGSCYPTNSIGTGCGINFLA